MSDEPKTTWELLNECLRPQLPYPVPGDLPPAMWSGDSHAFHFVCEELDKANRRIATLERQVREMATGGRR